MQMNGKGLALVGLLAIGGGHAGAQTWKCVTQNGVEYTDKPCGGGKTVELDPAPPPPPKSEPSRLVIIDEAPGSSLRLNRDQQRKVRGSIRRLEERNAELRQAIGNTRQRKERELLDVPLDAPERYSQMATINLYWNERINALEREYDRNLREISRLRALSLERPASATQLR